MDKIREAFEKVKKDTDSLYNEIFSLKQNLKKTHEEMSRILEILLEINTRLTKKAPLTEMNQNQQTPPHISTPQHIIPTHDTPLKPLKDQKTVISTGNGGVPTDKQTDKQTDTQHINLEEKPLFAPFFQEKQSQNPIDNAAEILDSLGAIKKEIRLKFKRLTDQEILVFSTLYQLEEEGGYTEYKILAQKLGLSESSIRDYVGRLIKKGIPVEKKKINNKTIHLSVSTNLKKIATLQTILQLRDL